MSSAVIFRRIQKSKDDLGKPSYEGVLATGVLKREGSNSTRTLFFNGEGGDETGGYEFNRQLTDGD